MVADRRACVGNGSVHRQRWCVELGGLSCRGLMVADCPACVGNVGRVAAWLGGWRFDLQG